MWVLGGFIGAVVTVKISVTLPRALDEAPAVGATELVGATGRVLWNKKREIGKRRGRFKRSYLRTWN